MRRRKSRNHEYLRMNTKSIYRINLHVSISFLLIGFLFRVMHWPGGSSILFLAYILSLVYVVIALMEIYKNESKSMTEKIAWFIGFILITPITGMYYYLSEMNSLKR